ncbi:hypothetical protein [Ruegeria sp. HKCCA6707]|uniref:hypothetical protein n=1 Tax=Ruegeria sp. HKCCA6707 TaxID=2682996 RepID=UPI001487AAB4|nr:hypothetical protein [Ruegeria sp. HKCCA6707]
MPEITTHAEWMAAKRRLRTLRGTERAELAAAITEYANQAARARPVNSGAPLAEYGRKHGSDALVREGMKNPYGLTPRANRKAGWS